MIQLLNDSRIKKEPNGDLIECTPKYYCINPKVIRGNFAFSHKEDLEEWVKDECAHHNIKKEELETGKIPEIKDIEEVSRFEIVGIGVCGGKIRENGK